MKSITAIGNALICAFAIIGIIDCLYLFIIYCKTYKERRKNVPR